MTTRLFAVAAFAASILAAGGAGAHAFLDHAVPAVGSTVSQPPAALTLWYTEAVEPAFSGVAVTDAAGRRVDTGKIAVDPHNAQEVHVPLTALAPGTYTVRWHVVSVDTHRTQGDFTFTVER